MSPLWFELADWLAATTPTPAPESLRARLGGSSPEIGEDRPAWWAKAACRSAPVEIDFFPLPGESPDPAIAVCRRCAARSQCLDYALAQGPQLTGVWAGTTDQERAELRRTAKAS